MPRYSPSVLPDDREHPALELFLSELSRGPERLHQMRADRRAQEESEYQRSRRERLDPLEEALLHAQLYERGVVPADMGEPTLADAVDGERDRGADLLSGRARFGDQGLSTGRGVMAPGSFNPITGSFNSPFDIDPGFTAPRLPGARSNTDPGFTAPRIGPQRDIDPGFTAPRPGRIPLGGGYELDPSLTEHGRTEARQQRIIDAMVTRGVPREEAEAEVLAGLEGAMGEHFHPGPYHPRTMEEYLNVEKDLIRARGEADLRVTKERARDKSDRDPRVKERRDAWEQQLGPPRNQLEQDVLDFLADGDSVEDIIATFPKSKEAAIRSYLSGEEANIEERRYQFGRDLHPRKTSP